jgi:hypothetical protein
MFCQSGSKGSQSPLLRLSEAGYTPETLIGTVYLNSRRHILSEGNIQWKWDLGTLSCWTVNTLMVQNFMSCRLFSRSGMGKHGLDCSGSGLGLVAGACECGNETSGSIKCWNFLSSWETTPLLERLYSLQCIFRFFQHFQEIYHLDLQQTWSKRLNTWKTRIVRRI